MSEQKYYVVIGMEIHAELKTKSKMWCSCLNDPFNSEPNQNVCPICLAEPGALPVANIEAIKNVIKVGLSTNSEIANFTEFDRKNYFYPDIPKGYQISQYKYPIVSKGELASVPLTRIHLEEDTAKSDHAKGEYTLIDFNRAGVPLMELVTEPVIYNSKEEAGKTSSNFGKALQRLLRTLDVSDADMEKGQMRLEANISVTTDPAKFGTKCEVKNLNSFNSVEKAIIYEVDRHIELIEKGEKVIQETRGWDENKLETFSQRKKENAHDYRYFPDPDLPKMYLHKIVDLDKIKEELPMLPEIKKAALEKIELQPKQIEQLLDDNNLASYYFEASKGMDISNQKLLANYLLTDAVGVISKSDNTLKLPSATTFAKIINMISEGTLSSRGAKDLITDILSEDTDPETRAKELNLIQNQDPTMMKKIVEKVISENQDQWSSYKNGEIKLEMFFVGKCMKEAAGNGNPKIFIDIIKSL
ncbi:MAG: aspartyl-tRNA(Asn)/glutamyl-tRNA(Gln) amidotransferase subunit [Patescibacteria group bacterium]|nr:aspartyl-tRNA(Asn)/glutamyl-tRNA(Gln) amidotransferase subunit [Patescibacteria group bacterium]